MASDARLKSKSRTNGTCQASSRMIPDQKAIWTQEIASVLTIIIFQRFSPVSSLCCLRIQFHPLEKKARETLGDNFLRLKNCLHPKLPFCSCFSIYCPRSIQYHTTIAYSQRLLLSRDKCCYRISALAICKMQTCSIIRSPFCFLPTILPLLVSKTLHKASLF